MIAVIGTVAAFSLTSGLALAEPAQVTRFSVSTGFFQPCGGDLVLFDNADFFIVSRSGADSGGGQHSGVVLHVSGTGIDAAGNTFTLREVDTFAGNSGPDRATTSSGTASVDFRRVGETVPADDEVFRSVVHFTINANGELTADVNTVTFECR